MLLILNNRIHYNNIKKSNKEKYNKVKPTYKYYNNKI